MLNCIPYRAQSWVKSSPPGRQWCQGVLGWGNDSRWHDTDIDVDLKWILTASFRSLTKEVPHPNSVSKDFGRVIFLFFHSHHMLSQCPSLTWHCHLPAVLACPVTSTGVWCGFLYGCPVHCVGVLLKRAAWGVLHTSKWSFHPYRCCVRQSEAKTKRTGRFGTLLPALKIFYLE